MLTIQNFDNFISHPEIKSRHGKILPPSIRALICGPSNCGKTNVLLTLLIEPNGLRFENIYIYSKSLFQPKYIFLKNLMSSIKGIGYHEFNEHEEIVQPSVVKENSILIFDDIPVSEKTDKIKDYFAHGRHKLVDTFYICQTYAHTPKHLVRDNANLLIIFKQDELNLHLIHRDHVNTDMTYSQFYNMCAKCWNEKYGFIVINKDAQLNEGRYRCGFNKNLKLR